MSDSFLDQYPIGEYFDGEYLNYDEFNFLDFVFGRFLSTEQSSRLVRASTIYQLQVPSNRGFSLSARLLDENANRKKDDDDPPEKKKKDEAEGLLILMLGRNNYLKNN